jgi:hypothetical protein
MGNHKRTVMDHPSSGKAPKGASNPSSGATRGGPGTGKNPAPQDHTFGGTKIHGSIAPVKKPKNPEPISHAVPGGKTVKASGW